MSFKDYTKTYYYDYQMLKISLENSKIMLESYRFELDEILANEKENLERIQSIRRNIESRKRIISKQKKTLSTMGKVISTFPQHLKKIENEVFELDAIKNMRSDEIANELCITPQYVRMIKSQIIDKFKGYQKIVEANMRL